MNTFTIFLILIVVVAFLLVVVIMVQNPKGGGLSSSFGGGGTQQLGGVKKTTDFLDKSTWTLATVLLALILFSNVAIDRVSGPTESKALDPDAAVQPLPDATTPDVEETATKVIDSTKGVNHDNIKLRLSQLLKVGFFNTTLPQKHKITLFFSKNQKSPDLYLSVKYCYTLKICQFKSIGTFLVLIQSLIINPVRLCRTKKQLNNE